MGVNCHNNSNLCDFEKFEEQKNDQINETVNFLAVMFADVA